MSAKDPGEIFIHNLVARPILQHKISKNQDIPKAEDLEGDTSPFRASTIDSMMAKNIYQNPGLRLSENNQNLRSAPPEITAPTDAGGMVERLPSWPKTQKNPPHNEQMHHTACYNIPGTPISTSTYNTWTEAPIAKWQ